MKPQTQKYTDKVDAIRICRKLNINLRRLTQSSEDLHFSDIELSVGSLNLMMFTKFTAMRKLRLY